MARPTASVYYANPAFRFTCVADGCPIEHDSTLTRGNSHHHFREVTSTNDVARDLATKGATHGTVVTAELQTAGRGRLGRPWLSQVGQSLLMSVVLRPRVKADQLGLVTVSAAMAVAEAIEDLATVSTQIKWPNDLLIGGRKVSGILLETAQPASGAGVDFVVVGIGVNVLQRDFPDELADRATSLLLECGRPLDRSALCDGILTQLSGFLDMLHSGRSEALRQAFEQRLVGMHEPVELTPWASHRVAGILRGVGADGGILIESDDGRVQTYHAGDTAAT